MAAVAVPALRVSETVCLLVRPATSVTSITMSFTAGWHKGLVLEVARCIKGNWLSRCSDFSHTYIVRCSASYNTLFAFGVGTGDGYQWDLGVVGY